jgi:hypothetical protein
VAISPPASLRTRPSVCLFPTAWFAGGGLINEPLLASDASPQSCRHLSTAPLISILILSSRGDEGKVSYLSLRRRINRNSPSYFFRFHCCSYLRRSLVSGAPDAPPLLPRTDINGINLQRRWEGEYFDCVAPDLTQNSPILLGWYDVPPPAGDNKGHRGSEAPLNGLLICLFAIECVLRRWERQR